MLPIDMNHALQPVSGMHVHVSLAACIPAELNRQVYITT